MKKDKTYECKCNRKTGYICPDCKSYKQQTDKPADDKKPNWLNLLKLSSFKNIFVKEEVETIETYKNSDYDTNT